ncbi:LysR family transcriptional regulator [Gryllotalpicola reticulitermitis]|uniref:LysR family transcriptional regulator n=1 Tax=Gryllotalpicola reticulitermitis TaxID=1184153 RepID=A0ABV8Q9A7_9MICO
MDAQAELVAAARADLVSLRLLSALAASGSISGASRAAGISQQAASARLRELEQRIGIPLLHRQARGTTLTPDGVLAAQWASEVVEAADRFEAAVAALRGRTEPLAVASSLTIVEYLLPRWLISMRHEPGSPERALSVTATNSTEVIHLVESGSHQLGFIESPQDIGELVAHPIGRDELVVVTAPGHDWAKRARVTLRTLAATPLIAREQGSGTRLNAEQAMTEAGYPPVAPLVELPTTSAIRTTVASGAGAAILSILAVRDDLASGRLVRIRVRELRFIRELRAVHAAGTALPPALEHLMAVAARGD